MSETADQLQHHSPAAGVLILTLRGRLDVHQVAELWPRAIALLEKNRPAELVVMAEGVDYCDGAGIGLLVEFSRRQRRQGGQCEIKGLDPRFQGLLDLYGAEEVPESPETTSPPMGMAEDVGRATRQVWEGGLALVQFVGELTVALVRALRRPRRIRWRDALLIAEKVGVNGLPIITLVSFLVGLIMAFQAAIPMRQFGVEIYVANLISLSMLRELGPLMTALMLAGRTGSAFAAEIGTMKVNEEIDALVTMGLDPVRFLVVNRVLATLMVTPLLAVYADLIGIMGGSVVLLSLGYPLQTYILQVLGAADFTDLAGGLFKAMVFGLIVAGVGCLRGLRTEAGPSAVGDSATRAVVAGSVLIVVADGIFSTLFYYLGI